MILSPTSTTKKTLKHAMYLLICWCQQHWFPVTAFVLWLAVQSNFKICCSNYFQSIGIDSSKGSLNLNPSLPLRGLLPKSQESAPGLLWRWLSRSLRCRALQALSWLRTVPPVLVRLSESQVVRLWGGGLPYLCRPWSWPRPGPTVLEIESILAAASGLLASPSRF